MSRTSHRWLTRLRCGEFGGWPQCCAPQTSLNCFYSVLGGANLLSMSLAELVRIRTNESVSELGEMWWDSVVWWDRSRVNDRSETFFSFQRLSRPNLRRELMGSQQSCGSGRSFYTELNLLMLKNYPWGRRGYKRMFHVCRTLIEWVMGIYTAKLGGRLIVSGKGGKTRGLRGGSNTCRHHNYKYK